MIFSISRFSTSVSCAAVISPFSRLARASLSGAVRKMLPTTSARNGGLVFGIGDPPEILWRQTSGPGALRQLQNNAARLPDGLAPNTSAIVRDFDRQNRTALPGERGIDRR